MVARPPQLIGESPLFHALLDRVSDLASLDAPVLITGEPGTGKDLMASRMHFLSPRWEQSFGSVNCAAYKEEELAEILFGRADYTGRASLEGKLLSADGGTFLLKHVETLSPELQEKLSRVILHGEFEPLGSLDTETVDIRFISTTRADLPNLVLQNEFGSTLLNALSFEVLRLPVLRGRFEDITALAEYFGRKIAATLGADSFPGFTPEALSVLAEQPWPDNVSGLKLVAERSVAHAFLSDESLSQPISQLRLNPFGTPPKTPEPAKAAKDASEDTPELQTTDFTERVMAFERNLIDQALNLTDHHQGKAADYLGLTYHQFRGLLRKHGMKK